MGNSVDKIRNIALIGHSGEGKTTLAEAMLLNMKVIDRQGKVEDGNTVMDFDPEEIAKKSSISLATAGGMFNGHKINIIDTPGFFDFECEMNLALDAADCAVIVTGGSGSLTVGTEKAIESCAKRKIPAILFINGLDKDNSSFIKTVQAIKEKFGNKIAPMIVPDIQNEKMKGFVKVAYGVYRDWDKNESPIPAHLQADYEAAHTVLCEAAAENDEELLDKYFSGEELTGEEIEKGVKIGTISGSTIGVLGGSAAKNHGIANLLDKIVSTLPNPLERGGRNATNAAGEKVAVKPVAEEGTVVKVFKTIVDPFVGKLNLVKVMRGVLRSGTSLTVVGKGHQEKISSIYFVKGKKQETVDCIEAGDIGALAKLSNVSTGDVLCEGGDLTFKPVEVPPAVYSMAVSAAKKGEEDKIFAGLHKLMDEDISFAIEKNHDTGEMLLAGVGETQLALICRKLKNKFGCEAVLTEPKIAYRETLRKMAEGEGKHKKQSGGAGQYGHCKVRFEPGAEDGLYEFVDAVVGGAIPNNYIPAVDKGLREAVKEGILAGYPMVNVKCTVFDGSSHPVDSKEVAYVSAAKLAYQAAMPNARPCILEPIMSVEVIVPDNYMGDVMGDMNKRRGRIMGTNVIDGKAVVSAEAPQGELAKYATDLRSMTQGRGSFTTKFERYEEVPPQAQEKIIKEAKGN